MSGLVFLSGWWLQPTIFNNLNLQCSHQLLDLPPADSLDKIAQHLAAKIKDQSTIIAWSLSGLIALRLARLYPDKIAKLVLISTSPKFTATNNWPGIDQKQQANFKQLIQQRESIILTRLAKLVAYPDKIHIDHHFDQRGKSFWQDYLALLFTSDLRQDYQQLSQPVLHVQGSKDAIINPEISHLQKLNPKINIKTIKNAGHAPFITHRSLFESMLKEFIKL